MPNGQRAVLGGSLLVLLVGASRLGPWAVAWSARERNSAASAVGEVAAEEASIRRLSWTRDSLVARRVRLAAMDSTIPDGETPVLAAASLAELVSRAAEAAHAQLENIELLSDSSTTSMFVAIRVKASLTGDVSAVTRFLSRVETGPVLLDVHEVALDAAAGQPQQPGSSLLRVGILVEGLARNGLRRTERR